MGWEDTPAVRGTIPWTGSWTIAKGEKELCTCKYPSLLPGYVLCYQLFEALYCLDYPRIIDYTPALCIRIRPLSPRLLWWGYFNQVHYKVFIFVPSVSHVH